MVSLHRPAEERLVALGQDLPSHTRRSSSTVIRVLSVVIAVGALLFGVLTATQVLAIGAGVVAVAVMFRPDLGLGLLVFLTYTRLSDALIESIGAPSILKPFVVFLLAVVVIRWFGWRDEVGSWALAGFVLSWYVALLLGSLLHASDTEVVVSAISDFLRDGLIMLLLVMLLTTEDRLLLAVRAVVFGAAFLSLFTVWQQVAGSVDQTYWGLAETNSHHIVGRVSDDRAGGPGLGANGFSQILLLALPMAIDRLRTERTAIGRGLALGATGLILAAVVFTYSRQGFAVLALVLGLLVVYYRMDLRKVLVAGLLAGLLVVAVAPPAYFDRIATVAELGGQLESGEISEVSFRGRLSEYLAAIQMFVDHPVAGVGISNYNSLYLEYSEPLGLDPRREDRSPHSLYLEIASELGAIGLAWFLILNTVAFRNLRQARRVARRERRAQYHSLLIGIEVALISFLLTSLFRHAAFPRYLWLVYGLAFAAPFVARLRSGEPTGDGEEPADDPEARGDEGADEEGRADEPIEVGTSQ